MATKRRPTTAGRDGRGGGSRGSTSSRSRGRQGQGLELSPQVARSLVGLVLLVTGVVTLIALLLPAGGLLNRFVSDVLRPAFGQGAWLLPVLLIVAGIFVERAPSVGNGWRATAIGGLVTFLGSLGLIHLLWGRGASPEALRQGGGAVGNALSASLSSLVSAPGAFAVLVGLIIAGVLLLFNVTIVALFAPLASWGRAAAEALARPVDERDAEDSADPARRGRTAAADAGSTQAGTVRGRGGSPSAAREPTAVKVEDGWAPGLPAPERNPAPISQTVWHARPDELRREAPAVGGLATSVAAGPTPVPDGPPGTAPPVATAAASSLGSSPSATTLLAAEDAPEPVELREWRLPPIDLLDDAEPAGMARRLDHEKNIVIIEEKLRSFQIPATVTATNIGPVVTQYEVRPDARVKLSRIEGLADDLAMALAARSIRIEAPIPGKDVVGIEIPNHASEIVGFRRLLEDANLGEGASKLTFALGRDVSGRAYAVDLAKMPHLLIAGATGSGKSVCVNALITSLLMRARPDEVRLILVDLKRVELAAYQGLPHLLTDVIVEAGEAKAALHWAVAQMEERYKALATRGERNITAYNASPKVEPHERLPYIVIVIDELADLIMREGRKVEDPVVKIAQKARAVGIHLVLATQRPSVNVVTGLIKANVPSRIAFAMASNVDSRTVLDAPGAEDLIGRGDMLYQPADLPRPVRLQGVFVSDAEVQAVARHWTDQAPEPEYDPAVVAFAEGESRDGGQFGWLAGLAEDDMAPRAAELVVQTGKASTSMLQTKLKVGFNRASRLMEELERVGIVGPQDPRNPAVPRVVYGPENWLKGPEDVDAPGYG